VIVTDTDVYLTVADSKGETAEYSVNPKNVTVRKNGTVVTMSSVNAGDKISKLTLKYGRVESVDAYSNKQTTSGLITELVISAATSITITDNNTPSTYKLGKDTKIYVFGELKEIYDLRLGQTANLTLDGSAVEKIEVSSNSSSSDVKGVVESVNTAYGFFTVKDLSGNSVQVFVNNSKTKIIDNVSANVATKTIRDIKSGQNVTAIGSLVNGAFEAQTVVITK
jgi:hypothetical protein